MKDDNYLQSKEGKIYKIMSNHLLQLSPWANGEDRRLYEYNDDDMTVISYQNACMIVNKQYNETDEYWEHKGKKYRARAIANKNIDEHTAMLSMLPSHYVKESSKVLKNLPDENSITFNDEGGNEFKMVKHQGKIGYILLLNKPNITRTKLFNIFGQFCKWVGIKDVKPIYCVDDKKYI